MPEKRSGETKLILRKHYSWLVLILAGVILIGLGLYFIFVRPPLLPEDPRYIGTSLAGVQASVPGLANWLQKVFWVMGGYMVATGLLTNALALTAFRSRVKGIAPVVALAGLSSIGWMVVVNFALNSAFRWLLLSFTLPWLISLVLYFWESKSVVKDRST